MNEYVRKTIQYVCVVGQVGFTEEERDQGWLNGCAQCESTNEEHLRVDGQLLCVECAAKVWNRERAGEL